MTNYVLLGLIKRRAELTGEADALKARLAQIGTDAMHLEAVIRQFDPDYDLTSIKSIRSAALMPRSGESAVGCCWTYCGRLESRLRRLISFAEPWRCKARMLATSA